MFLKNKLFHAGDKKWYRAVVLETTITHASVIYVDFGNVEKVPLSSLLPIPKELLQHPFQIARCALAGTIVSNAVTFHL